MPPPKQMHTCTRGNTLPHSFPDSLEDSISFAFLLPSSLSAPPVHVCALIKGSSPLKVSLWSAASVQALCFMCVPVSLPLNPKTICDILETALMSALKRARWPPVSTTSCHRESLSHQISSHCMIMKRLISV